MKKSELIKIIKEETASVISMQEQKVDFTTAFRFARDTKKKFFMWRGNKYHTRLKGEDPKAWKAFTKSALPPESQLSDEDLANLIKTGKPPEPSDGSFSDAEREPPLTKFAPYDFSKMSYSDSMKLRSMHNMGMTSGSMDDFGLSDKVQ